MRPDEAITDLLIHGGVNRYGNNGSLAHSLPYSRHENRNCILPYRESKFSDKFEASK